MKERQHKKLNVGCGFDYREGYVNVDLHERHKPDLVADVLDLADFPTGFYEELVAQDVLEHVTRDNVRRALFEWNRVLVRGGRLFIRTTELGGLVRLLEAPAHQGILDQERLIQNVFGTQAYTGDFHLSGFTEPLFRFYLWEAGFEVESLKLLHGAYLDVWARKTRHLGFDRIDEQSDGEAFVRGAFSQLLGREPSPEELGAELSSLGVPQGRRGVVMKLLLGDERKGAMRTHPPPFPRTLHQPGLLVSLARKAKRMVKAVARR